METNVGEMIDLTDLEGRWFINQSNFPMWLKGDKSSPTFNYSIVNNKKGTFLLDRVEYLKNGKQKSINGVDKSLNAFNTDFVWRGNGILRVLKSKWRILYINKEDKWAIIHFEKTLFTPEGYDVISRQANIDADREYKIKEKLSEFGIEHKLTRIAQ